MSHEFRHPIIGQEALVKCYGLGRVTRFHDKFPHQWIEVRTYADGVERQYSPKHVRYVQIGIMENAWFPNADHYPPNHPSYGCDNS
jgi:hypothetical protein